MMRSKQEYIEDCAQKGEHIRTRHLATEAEPAELGPASRAAEKESWVRYWGAAGRRITSWASHIDEADAVAIAGLSGTPANVLLRRAQGDAPAVFVHVYPKSFNYDVRPRDVTLAAPFDALCGREE
jgi:hypothetical protein